MVVKNPNHHITKRCSAFHQSTGHPNYLAYLHRRPVSDRQRCERGSRPTTAIETQALGKFKHVDIWEMHGNDVIYIYIYKLLCK